LPVDVNLQRCQRNYYQINEYLLGAPYGSNDGTCCISHPTTMRAIPTYTYSAIRTTTGLDNQYISKEVFSVLMTSQQPYILSPQVSAEL